MTGLFLWLQGYVWPIPLPPVLTGSFAEIRGNHFHTGIDIAVQERIGVIPVLAVSEGYVWRVSVSHYSYGIGVYIKHDDGNFSVYGHLARLAPALAAQIYRLQKEKGQFYVEWYPAKGRYRVRRGDTIGWAGNTGISAGPHLHFEIRNADQEPLPPLRFFPQIKDVSPPVFFRVALMPLDGESHVAGQGQAYPVVLRQRGAQRFFTPDTVRAWGKVGVLISAYDRLGPSRAWNGVHAARLYVNDSLVYGWRWDRLNFFWKPFLYAHRAYTYEKLTGSLWEKMYQEDPSILPPTFLPRKGILHIQRGLYRLRIEIEDFHGNITIWQGHLQAWPAERVVRKPVCRFCYWQILGEYLYTHQPAVCVYEDGGRDSLLPTLPLRLGPTRKPIRLIYKDTSFTPRLHWLPKNKELNLTIDSNFYLKVFEKSLLYDQYVAASWLAGQYHPRQVGKAFFIGDFFTPLYDKVELRVRMPQSCKRCIVVQRTLSGAWESVRGQFRRGGWVVLPITRWGTFCFIEDNLPPQARLLKVVDGFQIIRLQDKESEVQLQTVKLFIDKRPVPVPYFPTQGLIYLDTRLWGKGKHTITLQARDLVGNDQTYTWSVIW